MFYACSISACPICKKPNKDKTDATRHFAFAHRKIFELTEVTPAHLGSSRDWERKEDGGRGAEPGDTVEEGKKDKMAEETAKNDVE